MSNETDALVRLGLALFRHSEASGGDHFIDVQTLVFSQIAREAPRGVFKRLFGGESFDFWGQQESLAKKLSSTGLAEMHSRQVSGDHSKHDYFLKITPFGRALFRMASNAASEPKRLGSLAYEDLDSALRDATTASALADDLTKGRSQLNSLPLTNAEAAAAQAYVDMLISITGLPNPDASLFWKVLERLDQFAGVASLIVALIALRLAK